MERERGFSSAMNYGVQNCVHCKMKQEPEARLLPTPLQEWIFEPIHAAVDFYLNHGSRQA
jgi:hypothetical protein